MSRAGGRSRAGGARERQEPAAKVGNWSENIWILAKFCLRKTKLLAMFLVKTEPGKFSLSKRKGSLAEEGVDNSQEKANNRFSFRILLGNR